VLLRDVADRFCGWQQLTNYRDPENKSGALGGDILKKQTFVENCAKWQSTNNNDFVAPPGKWNGKIKIL